MIQTRRFTERLAANLKAGLPIVLIIIGAPVARANDSLFSAVAQIFQQRCLSCHGSSEAKGGFSLETADRATEDGYIQPGDAATSHLIELVTSVDGRAEMPKDAKPLTEEEVASIRDWINAGANWPKGYVLEEPSVGSFDWWSYQPLVRSPVPKSNDPWAASPIDAFVLAKLQERGLSYSVPADRRALIRRVTFDLTGMPPTPEQVQAFVDDIEPLAYERLVDRLLGSKDYGERWARHWLDVVKYADTHGYDKDKLRPNAWPYRDYVVRSFNDDKPYARFIHEQIAGDVLYPGQPDGILGLGFIAAGPWDFIGHAEVPESKIDGKVARNLDRDDMVSNAMNTFCSVTVQCARCHNHKFDPITQEHYYGLQSLFAAVDRADRSYDADPEVERRRIELTSKLTKLNGQQKTFAKEVEDLGGPRLKSALRLIDDLKREMQVVKDPAFGYHSAITKLQDSEKWVEVQLDREVRISQIVLHPCHDDFANIGSGFGFPIRFRIEAFVDDLWVTVLDRTESDFPSPGLTPVKTNTLDVTASKVRLTATRLAKRKEDFILALSELEIVDSDGNNLAKAAKVASLDSIEAPVRWGRSNLVDGLWPRGGSPDVQERLGKAIADRDAILKPISTPERIARDDRVRKSIDQTKAKLAALPKGKMVYAAATSFKAQSNFKPTDGKLRPVHVLHRGNVTEPKSPAVPGFLPFDDSNDFRIDASLDDRGRREALARWLTRNEHPLVWRSIVNRIWQYHFGRGIVASPNDLGRMGELPTHPELLDWLAASFRDGGQSMKSLHRMLVTSNVYRQSSVHDEANALIDGSNQYLWRSNRRRLSAEEIRDSILAVSGTLDRKSGGPGFYLFELEKTQHSPHYEYHKFDPNDHASHRRSIYRFVVRSQPDPWMTTLDCADSSQSTPRRNETLTSLQALSLLNNRFNLVMAERFADRVKGETIGVKLQVQRAVELAVQRSPTTVEIKELVAYAERHGLVNLCRVLFNMSEFVFVD